MTLLAGAPKTLKSTIAMCMAAAIADGIPVRNYRRKNGKKSISEKRRTVIYVAYEQSVGRLRHAYEKRILRRELLPKETHFCVVDSPWEYQIDADDNDFNCINIVKQLKPALLIIDPLVHAHGQDENDPRMVRPLVPLREAALKVGTSVLLIHHLNKKKGDDNRSSGGTADFDRVRGTSALWGMVDAGHIVTKSPSGGLFYTSDFKDFPSRQWSWRAP